MPELPEVETTRRGLTQALEGARIKELHLHRPDLRWPMPAGLAARVRGQRISRTDRRGKYLLLHLQDGALLIHLGMSGSLRLERSAGQLRKHDHWHLTMARWHLIYNDPRRFGALLWQDAGAVHPLLASLGPEPWDCDSGWLHERSRGRRQPIKNFIMDSGNLVGVGNIYAQEALFMAAIHPATPAMRLGRERWQRLLKAILRVLEAALDAGGSTLRDYRNSDDKPGYFQLSLLAYGRGGQPCTVCGTTMSQGRQGQRATVWCPTCQRP